MYSPYIKQEIIDWELFKFSCLNCRYACLNPYETVYYDIVKGLEICYLPIIAHQSIGDKYNDLRSPATHYLRIVTDIESFVEKVQIFEAGYDDRVIELMKSILAPKEEEDIQFNYDKMVFTKVGENNYHFMFIRGTEAVASLQFSKELYNSLQLEYGRKFTDTHSVDESWAYQFISKF
ncbi:CpXC domain-containing protein [Streptococcus suis]